MLEKYLFLRSQSTEDPSRHRNRDLYMPQQPQTAATSRTDLPGARPSSAESGITVTTNGGVGMSVNNPQMSAANKDRGRAPYRGEVVEHNQGRIILNLKPLR